MPGPQDASKDPRGRSRNLGPGVVISLVQPCFILIHLSLLHAHQCLKTTTRVSASKAKIFQAGKRIECIPHNLQLKLSHGRELLKSHAQETDNLSSHPGSAFY